MSLKSLQGRRTTYATRIKLTIELQTMTAETNESVCTWCEIIIMC